MPFVLVHFNFPSQSVRLRPFYSLLFSLSRRGTQRQSDRYNFGTSRSTFHYGKNDDNHHYDYDNNNNCYYNDNNDDHNNHHHYNKHVVRPDVGRLGDDRLSARRVSQLPNGVQRGGALAGSAPAPSAASEARPAASEAASAAAEAGQPAEAPATALRFRPVRGGGAAPAAPGAGHPGHGAELRELSQRGQRGRAVRGRALQGSRRSSQSISFVYSSTSLWVVLNLLKFLQTHNMKCRCYARNRL